MSNKASKGHYADRNNETHQNSFEENSVKWSDTDLKNPGTKSKGSANKRIKSRNINSEDERNNFNTPRSNYPNNDSRSGSRTRKIEVTIPTRCKPTKQCQPKVETCHHHKEANKCKGVSTSCQTTERSDYSRCTEPESCCNPDQNFEIQVSNQGCRENMFPFILNANGNYEIHPKMVIFQTNIFALIVANPDGAQLGVNDKLVKPDSDCDDSSDSDSNRKANERSRYDHRHKHHSSQHGGHRTHNNVSNRNAKSPTLPPPPKHYYEARSKRRGKYSRRREEFSESPNQLSPRENYASNFEKENEMNDWTESDEEKMKRNPKSPRLLRLKETGTQTLNEVEAELKELKIKEDSDESSKTDDENVGEWGQMNWSQEEVDAATLIQSKFRGWKERKRYLVQREAYRKASSRKLEAETQVFKHQNNIKTFPLPKVKQLTLENTDAIIILGGWNPGKKWSASNSGREIQQYNMISRKWLPMGILPEPRVHFGAVYIQESIIVFGGSDLQRLSEEQLPEYHVSSTWKLDITTGIWEVLQDMNVPRSKFGYILFGGKIYVFGGLGEGQKVLSSYESYDPETNTWKILGSMPVPRMNMSVANVVNSVCIIGGQIKYGEESAIDSVTLFDPVTNRFLEKKSLPNPRYLHTTLKYKAKVFVLGGVTKPSIGDNMMNTGRDICFFEDGNWKNVGDLKIQRYEHCQVQIGQYAILFGGVTYPATQATNSVDVVNLEESRPSNTKITHMPSPLLGHVGIFIPMGRL